MFERALAVVLVAACSSPPARTPPPSLPAEPPPVAAPVPPTPVDLEPTLIAIGKRRHPELATRTMASSEGIPAFGPCTRPTDAEKTAIRDRVFAWTNANDPGKRGDLEDLKLSFGCVDRTGVIVSAQMDRYTRRGYEQPKYFGFWGILRVGPRAIDVLAKTTGTAALLEHEWQVMTKLEALAVADLDGDGSFDVIAVHDHYEVLAIKHDITLSTIVGGKQTSLARFGDRIELAIQPTTAGEPIVVAMTDEQLLSPGGTVFRCIDGGPQALKTCPRMAGAKRHLAAVRAAERLASARPGDLAKLDRDEAAELLDQLAIPEVEQRPVLAALPSDRRAVVARAVVAFAHGIDGDDQQLSTERAQRRADDHDRFAVAARAALGVEACPPVPLTASTTARVKAWIAANDRAWIAAAAKAAPDLCMGQVCRVKAPSEIRLAPACTHGAKSYVFADWKARPIDATTQSGIDRQALLFVDATRQLMVQDKASALSPFYYPQLGEGDPSAGFAASFYVRGGVLIAISQMSTPTTATEGPLLVTAGDGVVRERRTGSSYFYSGDESFPSESGNSPLVNLDGGVWYAKPELERVGTLPPPTPPTTSLERLIFTFTERPNAKTYLRNLDAELADHDEVIRELGRFGAPDDLIAKIRGL